MTHILRRIAAALLLAAVLWPASTIWNLLSAPGQQPTPPPLELPGLPLTGNDSQEHDLFGYAVAAGTSASVPVIVAGAPGVGGIAPADQSGAAYVFEQQAGAWVEVARLASSAPQPGARFGSAVALSGDTIAVGAPYTATDTGGPAAGAVWIYTRLPGGWVEQARLTAPDGFAFDLFGSSLALEGNTLVVGTRAAEHPTGIRNAGAAYVFAYDGEGWVEQARLSAADAGQNDFFGDSLAILGDTVAVASPGQDDPRAGDNSGMVYLFNRREGLWFPGPRLVAPDAVPQASFGAGLLIRRLGTEETLATAAYTQLPDQRDPSAPLMHDPAVYLFTSGQGTWSQAARLPAALSGEGLFVRPSVTTGLTAQSQPLVALGGWGQPQVYLYIRQESGWLSLPALAAPDSARHSFGYALALDGSTLAAGSPWATPTAGGPATGAVYVYNLSQGLP